MKILLIIAVLFSESLYSQNIDSTIVTIPTHKLDFKQSLGNISSSQFGDHQLIIIEGDSVFILNSKSSISIYKKSDGALSSSRLSFTSIEKEMYNLGDNPFYHFYIDSLGSNIPYVVILWDGKSVFSSSTNTGSGEFQCNQIVTTYKQRITGMTLVNILEMEVLFRGITTIKKTSTEKIYPGNKTTETENTSIKKVRFDHEDGLLFIRKFDEPEYSGYMFYDELTPGVYSIENNRFVLKKSY